MKTNNFCLFFKSISFLEVYSDSAVLRGAFDVVVERLKSVSPASDIIIRLEHLTIDLNVERLNISIAFLDYSLYYGALNDARSIWNSPFHPQLFAARFSEILVDDLVLFLYFISIFSLLYQ